MRRLTHCYIWLIGLSLGSTAIAALITTLTPEQRRIAGVVILFLAWAKARLILNEYLGLANAPFWRRGFGTVLGFFVLGLLALYLAPLL